MSVEKILTRDRELRAHATQRPWHQSGLDTRLRIVGPLPQASVVVDPYGPNPQDAPLLLHRVNTYEELEEEILRLREALRAARTVVESTKRSAGDLLRDELHSLARDVEAGIDAALGEHRGRVVLPGASEDARRQAARIDEART